MLGNRIGILRTAKKLIPAWLGGLTSRVVSDGGATENSQCVKGDIKRLQSLERTNIILTLLEIELSAEGGSIEAKECLINSMEELHTIL